LLGKNGGWILTREAIELLHNTAEHSNLTDAEARWLLTLAEHILICLGEMEWLDALTFNAVTRFVAGVNDARPILNSVKSR
jgi:hypothetical protein